MKLRAFANWVREILEQPRTVFVSCLALVFLSLLLNGTFWRLWNLQRDKERKAREMLVTVKETEALKTQLLQAKDPAFIEHQAKDRLDFAGENDLVFVFAAQ
jgi:cell division protein FtsB